MLFQASAHAWSLHYLGQQILPHDYYVANTPVGGLSGLEFDAESNQYYALSDDRSERSPARFYTLTLDLDKFTTHPDPGHAGIHFIEPIELKASSGLAFQPGAVDPEAIRRSHNPGRLFWSSEGNAAKGIPPAINESTVTGDYIRSLPIPSYFLPQKMRGVRNNLAFESLAITSNTARLYVGTESALLQDGPEADNQQGSLCRILAYDLQSGVQFAEYAYPIDPVPLLPLLPMLHRSNGLVELLAIDDENLLALERAYAQGTGNSIRLYQFAPTSGSNIIGVESLQGADFRPLAKTLLLNFDSLAIRLDNIEGMTWGPRRANGNRTLLFVSDNNFNPRQITQFLAFELIP